MGVQLLVLGLLIAWPELVLREKPAAPMDPAAVERALDSFAPTETEPVDPSQRLMESLPAAR